MYINIVHRKKNNSDAIVRELLYYLGVTGHLL